MWTRDLVQSATALLAAGDLATPLRVLVYLAVSQRADGGFFQNFWIDGRPYWSGVQLDEVSFPLVLAWRLHQADALGGFDPGRHGGGRLRVPDAGRPGDGAGAVGRSGGVLAVDAGDQHRRADLRGGADGRAAATRRPPVSCGTTRTFSSVTSKRGRSRPQGSLHPDVARHYIRINPNTDGREDPNTGTLTLANQPPGGPYEYPARDIVDAGFLELVRYGIRDPHDPIVVDSLKVVDAVLKVELPQGPFWRRYNHDGYGQRADGTSFKGWGVGRPWPLLTGERGHYELAAGRDARPYLRTMQQCAVGIGLIPEQVWDQSAIPDKLLMPGGPTGAAIPLAWAHAEYIKLVRSIADQRVFDLIAPVRARYAGRGRARFASPWKSGAGSGRFDRFQEDAGCG